ncbi:tRNA modification GTPase [Aequorivita marina]|uniref:tRNA modification GTPase n=1 Tax=Aequorivita marina TaxID=3073654 RepID=UPI002874981C|nr:tRNA modification GTPase [Aequorivita sp. S2608]MDS1299587.1 tRNA modification GTPase [Aequorivita sp. S2608]
MKLKLITTLLLLSAISLFSQTDYEAGYIIKTNGQKLDCLIKNEDWKGSPSTFNYKLEKNGAVKTGNVSTIKEFGSETYFKYIVETVAIEQSSDKVSNLTEDRNPDFKDETRFLKVLIEGDASLYFTTKNNENRFFYKINEGEIEPLVYKRFLTKNKRIAENNRYKQQLATDITCSEMANPSLKNLEYKRTKLINQFKKYNTCLKAETVVYKKKAIKYGFNLSLRPGITFGSASIQKSGETKLDFGNKSGFRVGLEAEYIFPFHNGKWSIFIEPTYQSYTADTEIAINTDFPTMQNSTVVTVDYSALEVPIGGRFYMFLNKDAAFFINGALLVDLSVFDSSIKSSNDSKYDLEFASDATTAVGAGFKYKNKYSIEARYHTSRNIINYTNVNATYSSFAIIAGYNFL